MINISKMSRIFDSGVLAFKSDAEDEEIADDVALLRTVEVTPPVNADRLWSPSKFCCL